MTDLDNVLFMIFEGIPLIAIGLLIGLVLILISPVILLGWGVFRFSDWDTTKLGKRISLQIVEGDNR